ncbi:MAG: hypothetical protein JSR58_02650 [Verrucomicrobia bacterium]|nr:hypothetical protein [Verrucomicrobiota bacterium]
MNGLPRRNPIPSGVSKAGMSWSIPWALGESRSFMSEFFNQSTRQKP